MRVREGIDHHVVARCRRAGVIDHLSDVLDDATWNDDLVASAGAVSFDQDSEQLDWSGDLAPGAVVTITYSVTVTGDGDQSLINQVTSPGCASPETCGTTHLYAPTRWSRSPTPRRAPTWPPVTPSPTR